MCCMFSLVRFPSSHSWAGVGTWWPVWENQRLSPRPTGRELTRSLASRAECSLTYCRYRVSLPLPLPSFISSSPPSLPPSIPPSLHPSISLSLPPSLPPSISLSLPPSIPPSLHPSLPPVRSWWETPNCALTLSTLSVSTSWESRKKTFTIPSSLSCRYSVRHHHCMTSSLYDVITVWRHHCMTSSLSCRYSVWHHHYYA